MRFDDLLQRRKIHRHRASTDEIARLIQLADRDLKMARHTMPEDWDWGFSIAYNAVLQSARAYMYSRGFRPTASQGHKNTFAFMRVALGDEFSTIIGYFDRMRAKRNQAIYDVAGLITERMKRKRSSRTPRNSSRRFAGCLSMASSDGTFHHPNQDPEIVGPAPPPASRHPRPPGLYEELVTRRDRSTHPPHSPESFRRLTSARRTPPSNPATRTKL